MKTPLLFVGIEVTRVTVKIFGIAPAAELTDRDRPSTQVAGRAVEELGTILLDALRESRTPALIADRSPAALLAGSRGSILKSVLARGALLALPAAAAVLAPAVAKKLLSAAGNSRALQTWLHNRLPAPPPRLPYTGPE